MTISIPYYEPQVGDYAVIKTSGFFGFLIRLGTFSRWNHAVISIGNGEAISADPRGVKIDKISSWDNLAWNKHEGLTEDQRHVISAYALHQVGQPYDFFTILEIALRILGLKVLAKGILNKLAQRKGYICSELVAECYREAGVTIADKDYLCTPGDLAERLIWQ